MDKALIIGYGNPDRADDGAAWYILKQLASRLELPEPGQDIDSLRQQKDSLGLLCTLQLDPQMADLIADYDRVCFVDAHTAAYPDDIRYQTIEGKFQASPFTHHMTPETCLALTETLYGYAPPSVVISVKGYQFEFSPTLSSRTAKLAEEATKRLIDWLIPEN
jgi:hydrogenase maturation protease